MSASRESRKSGALHITLNHDTELFRVSLGSRTLGRFEEMRQVVGRNGVWWVFEGPEGTVFLLDRGK